MIITKNDLIQALQRNFKKKNILLYLYYQEIFDSSQSSSFVQMKIFDELGIELSKSHIDTIRYRLDKASAKKMKAEVTFQKNTDFTDTNSVNQKSFFTDPFAFKNQKENNIIRPIQ